MCTNDFNRFSSVARMELFFMHTREKCRKNLLSIASKMGATLKGKNREQILSYKSNAYGKGRNCW